MPQIPRSPIPLTVSLFAPDGATWLEAVGDKPEERLDPYGDVVEWLVRKTEAHSDILVPVQVYGLLPDGRVVEGPSFGLNNISADPSDVHDESWIRVHTHYPGVIAYWIVPTAIVGTPDVLCRTVNVGVYP